MSVTIAGSRFMVERMVTIQMTQGTDRDGTTAARRREDYVTLLREYADALDKDRGHDKSMVTRLMRGAADLIENVQGDVYLWGIEELDDGQAIRAVSATLQEGLVNV